MGFAGLALWMCASIAAAETPESQGARIYYACATCHGEHGEADEARQTPALSVLSAWYIAAQLRAYRAGWRGTEGGDFTARKMTLFAEVLAFDQDLDAVSEYAASLGASPVEGRQEKLPGTPAASPDAATTRHFEGCASCHGPAGEGIETLGAPPIAGQPAWYLERQMAAFSSGDRGAHPDDAFGRQMRAAPVSTSPGELAALIAYLSRLPRP